MYGGHSSICQNYGGIWKLSIEIPEVLPTPRSSSFLQCSLSRLLSHRVIKTIEGLWTSMTLHHIFELVSDSLNPCTAILNMYSKYKGFSCLDYGCWIRKFHEITMTSGTYPDIQCPQPSKVVFIASMRAGTFPRKSKRHGQGPGGARTIWRGKRCTMILSIETATKD